MYSSKTRALVKTRFFVCSVLVGMHVYTFLLLLCSRKPSPHILYVVLQKPTNIAKWCTYFFVLFIIHRYPSDVDMQKIVQCTLTPILEGFKNVSSNNNYANVDQLAFAMINVYSEVSQFINCVCFASSCMPLLRWIDSIVF